jgi:spermidine synthase
VNTLPRATGLAVLGVASASVVATEVLLTRLLSVATWYGLAFLVLSIAMLGTTSGALSAARARANGAPLAPWVSARLVVLALGLVGATLAVLSVPLAFLPDATSMGSVLLVVGAATVPMAAGGGVVARLMAELPVPVSRAYAVDLVSAAAGALVPLALLGPITGPSAPVAVAAVVSLAALVVAARGHRAAPIAVLATCVGLLWLTEATPHGLVVRWTKGNPQPPGSVLFGAWNPLSYVTLTPFSPQPFPLWSPGDGVMLRPHPVALAVIDGEADTFVYAYGTIDQVQPLQMDGTATAHSLRPDGTSCVIGVGGGRDLETALLFGHDRVYGFEINPSMVAMLRKVSPYSPILSDPRVHIVLGDARASLARTDVKCRVLQASLVDTWAATSAGAFAHTESTLYTLEAWSLFLRRVEPDGVLTFSRWYEPTRIDETARLVSLAVGALVERGVTTPRDHIALVGGGKIATLVVSPAPFSADDLAKLHAKIAADHLTLLFSPDSHPASAVLDRILDATSLDKLESAGEGPRLDTTPPTDDRPFFFQILAARAWLHPLETWRGYIAQPHGALAGNVAAAIELSMTAVATLLVALVLLGPTLLRAARERDPPLPGRAPVVYFASLGGGFMLAEVALVQRMHVVLGHPTYALVIVLAGLLVATGVGSALSVRVVKTRRAVSVVAIVAAAALALLPWVVIGPLARATLESAFGVRVAWCGATAAALGLVLGMLFPSALAFTERERATPIALALGGATSVVGSALAVVISVALGIPATFAVAAALYVLAAYCGPWRWRAAVGGSVQSA